MKEAFRKIKQFKDKHYSYELPIPYIRNEFDPRIKAIDIFTKPLITQHEVLHEDERPFERRRGW